MNRHALSNTIAIAAVALASPFARAADVVVQPAAGNGFVVKDAAGANERFRVQETGAVSLPSVAAAPAQPQGVCMSTAGQLGPCSAGTGGSYTAATGLSLAGTTFSVAPTYRLPQGCAANQIAQWNGTAWACGTAGGGALPPGTVNQTLRYDASNTPVANNLLQAFADGGLVAGGTLNTGSIPATGPGTRMMWYPALSAFRAGHVDGSQWDMGNVGTASIAMGDSTIASGDYSTAMGDKTSATGDFSTAMGTRSEARGDFSLAIGYETLASAQLATSIGYQTSANGYKSIAMGSNVGNGGYAGSFIYGDASTRSQVNNIAENQFMAVASGGFVLISDKSAKAGVYLKPGGSSWDVVSDRNAKTAFESVDARDVLARVVSLPLSTWHYKAQDASDRHMGPMAQDFYAAFHLGDSDKSINTIDADGVALAAIQGLNAQLAENEAKSALRFDTLREEKDREIATLRTEKDREIAALRTRISSLESVANDIAEVKSQLAALRQSAPAAVTVALRQP